MNPNDPYGHGCNPLVEADEQPHGVEHYTADGVYVRQCVINKAFTVIPQHAHSYPHLTMLAKGSMRAWKDGIDIGDFKAPCAIQIDAGTKHAFQTLEDDTVFYCIHNVSRDGEVNVKEEHQLVGEK